MKTCKSVRSIATEYGGITYRSRTEARWAVFFTQQKIPFRYEMEGFEMSGLRYLPDFWLPEGRCWFEVKPFDPDQGETAKALALARVTRRLVFIAPGGPSKDIGLYVASPSGAVRKDWRFAYAHEEGVGYICDNLWNCEFEIRIAAVTNPAGMYDFGPEQELESAGKHHFEWKR